MTLGKIVFVLVLVHEPPGRRSRTLVNEDEDKYEDEDDFPPPLPYDT